MLGRLLHKKDKKDRPDKQAKKGGRDREPMGCASSQPATGGKDASHGSNNSKSATQQRKPAPAAAGTPVVPDVGECAPHAVVRMISFQCDLCAIRPLRVGPNLSPLFLWSAAWALHRRPASCCWLRELPALERCRMTATLAREHGPR